MARLGMALAILFAAAGSSSFARAEEFSSRPDLTRPQNFTLHRASSADPTGANVDSLKVPAGATVTVLDVDGPGAIAHIWFTFGDKEIYHLKRIVLRIYWDGEATPSVESPVGDFFGLGLGQYHSWQSEVLSVGSVRSMNSFFAMPFARHARITLTNEGSQPMGDLYYNIDWRRQSRPLPKDTYYFHAQYRQSQPTHGWTNNWLADGDPLVNNKINPDGADNYVWADIKGRGHFVGVTMSVMQNQDAWWGEGDDMFFIDGEKLPSIKGTGAEDYFLGAHDFGGVPFSYGLYGAPVVGEEKAGGRSSVYRFHLEAPIPFETSFKAPLSMAAPIIARTIIIRSPIGTRPSRTHRSHPCRRLPNGCPASSRWVGPEAVRRRRTNWFGEPIRATGAASTGEPPGGAGERSLAAA